MTEFETRALELLEAILAKLTDLEAVATATNMSMADLIGLSAEKSTRR